ncbi:MAG: hypothetical protein J5874_05755 [Oscillospiraceae bacterium]|nr:hypothetical protein [Oscillospiraceae bacterium]
MKGWLIYSKKDAEKNRDYIDIYFEDGRELGIDFELIYTEELEIGVKNGELYILRYGKTVEKPDFAICRTIYPLLTRQLELLGIKVYNNSKTAVICNDKALCLQYVSQTGVPVLDSAFRKCGLESEFCSYGFPLVSKPVSGRSGIGVSLARNASELYENSSTYNEDWVLQPLCKSPGKDLRVFVVGKEIVGAILRSSDRDFRANYCLGGSAKVYVLSEKEREYVMKIVNIFDFGMVGVDFLFDGKNGLLFSEIEDVVGARTLYRFTDIDIVKKYLEFIKNDLRQ